MDLFTSHLSKKEQLYLWMKEKGYVRTSEVIAWGRDNFYNRAEREARELAHEKGFARMSEEEKRFRGFKTKEDIWNLHEKY